MNLTIALTYSRFEGMRLKRAANQRNGVYPKMTIETKAEVKTGEMTQPTKLRCCHYCQRTHRKNGQPFKNGRSVEDHERVCELNPDNKIEPDDELEDETEDYPNYASEIELTDSISIYR